MRIISGNFRGLRLSPPKGLPLRPTTDMAKEALFNILSNYFELENTRVLDLFSGTGSISFEFASRGCPDITLVEINPKCLTFIYSVVERLSLDQVRIIRADVFVFLTKPSHPFDLIFADPPYNHKYIHILPDLVCKGGYLREDGWFILEHPKELNFSGHEYFFQHRNYGAVQFTIFRNAMKV